MNLELELENGGYIYLFKGDRYDVTWSYIADGKKKYLLELHSEKEKASIIADLDFIKKNLKGC